MTLSERINDAYSRALEIKSHLLSKDCVSSSEDFARTKVLIELEKVRSNLLLAEALNRIATNVH